MSLPGLPQVSPLPLATDSQLEFWWAKPAGLVDYYQLACSSILYTQNLSSLAQQTRISGLINGQYYHFTIAAANQNGLGSPAAFDRVQPGPKPSNNRITDVKMMSPGDYAQLTWQSSQAPGEPDNLGYALIAVPSTPTLSTVKVSANSTQQSAFIGPLSTDIYTFSVYSVNSARWQTQQSNNSIIANTTLFEVPPQNPAIIIGFSTITNSSFTVIYSNDPRQSTSYYSFLINNIATPTKDQTGAITATATFNNLTAATVYSVIVVGNNNIGTNQSLVQSVTTLIDTPTPVTNISVGSPTTLSTLTVTWTASPNATDPYTFTFDGNPVVPQSQTTTQATFINLSPGIYSVVIFANNATGSAPSQAVNLATAPAAPSNISISNINALGFTVNWSTSSAATSYQISLDGGVTFIVQNLQTSPYAFTNLISGTNYSIVVKAQNSSGGSVSSPPLLYAFGLTKSQIQFFSNVLSTSFKVTWSAAVGDSPITYSVSIDNGATYPFNTVANSYTVTNLNPNTPYTVKIRATNNTNISTGDPLIIITKPSPPTDITFTNITPSSVVINWLTA